MTFLKGQIGIDRIRQTYPHSRKVDLIIQNRYVFKNRSAADLRVAHLPVRLHSH
jgi:hypothetical protein